MTLIQFTDLSELKQLKTAQPIADDTKFIVITSFYAHDLSGNQVTMVRGAVQRIDRAHNGYVIINGSVEIHNDDLREYTRPFSWTRSTRPGREKATIYPWR